MAPPSASLDSSALAPPTAEQTRVRSNSNTTTTYTQAPSLSTSDHTNSSLMDSNSSAAAAAPTSETTVVPFGDRILAAEHRFTSLTQNIAHFSPLKKQLDKHNLTIERLEADIKKKTVLLRSCQDKLQVFPYPLSPFATSSLSSSSFGKTLSKRPQTSGHGSHVSLQPSPEEAESDLLQEQQQATKEALDSLNGQLLAAKILHIGLTRQVTQYFESRSDLQKLLEEIFTGSTPEHPSEDALELELEKICAEIVEVKESFEKHRQAKAEFKEVRRYVDIWNDTVEKQVASNPKDVSKSFKKFVPFLGPKQPPSYTRLADIHMANARTFVPTLEDIGLLCDIKMDTIADTSNGLIIYTAKFKDAYNLLSHTLETLHKKSRVLKKRKFVVMEKLFDERCRIFSVELQAHYRSIGESLVGASESAEDAGTTNWGSSAGGQNHLRVPVHRQHVEANLDSYSSEGGSSLGPNSQEILLVDDELPSYFQHDHEAQASMHRRTGSLGSPARSSSSSSSISLSSPNPHRTTDSPPDYERTESGSGDYSHLVGVTSGMAGASLSTAITTDDGDEDAMFRAYHQRYDTRRRQDSDPRTRTVPATRTTRAGSMTAVAAVVMVDTPPGYDDPSSRGVVDPV
ncbi:hypothetical protein EMPS_05901 [Entomortierella parvispora]|uniref:Uncharacterized protein n=1 Tax=Entomortierella parvispora TaxID=205924 RepID=A0A9P3HBR5_9FUNG|nr:hypothetical protein EMPS_05901 [Entomortierella parvispora]